MPVVAGWRTILPPKVVGVLDRGGIKHCDLVDYAETYHDMTDTLIRIVQYRITHGETDIFLTYETGVGNQQEYHQFRLAIELNFERGACSTRISVAFDIEESERVLSRTFSHLNSLVHFSKMAIEPITGALRV